jgi:predicted GNAT family acetyltransferase
MLDHHIEDVTKVGIINFAAFAVSMSDISDWLRLAGLAAALVYTCLKILQTVIELRKK